MDTYQNRVSTEPFRLLNQRERLFLYLVRHWGQHVSRQLRSPGLGEKNSVHFKKRDASLDRFMRCFGASLPEPLMLKPPYCRCDVQFHEAALLAAYRGAVKNDPATLNEAVADMMPHDVIERLAVLLRPLVSEIELAMAELF